jgi:predicted nucleotidyltransferase
MLVLHRTRFINALRRSRYKTMAELARAVGIHRNTLHYYLAGRPLISEKIESTLDALDLPFSDAVVQLRSSVDATSTQLAPLIDAFHAQFPEVTVVLFGSRAGQRAHRYSDVDLGVYSGDGISHARFRQMLEAKSELEEASPLFIDLTNLNRADPAFLRRISRTWRFVCGWQLDWVALQEKALQ